MTMSDVVSTVLMVTVRLMVAMLDGARRLVLQSGLSPVPVIGRVAILVTAGGVGFEGAKRNLFVRQCRIHGAPRVSGF